MHRYEVKVMSFTSGKTKHFTMYGTSLRAVPKEAAKRVYGDKARFTQAGTKVEIQDDGWYRVGGTVVFRKGKDRFSIYADQCEAIVVEVRKSGNAVKPGTVTHD